MSERATCATKGCGAEIQWGKTSGKWFHNSIGLWSHHAHPAGGTNYTPPEEAVEEATAEEGKWRDEYNAQKMVMADLRDQLDRALVPKYAIGEPVRFNFLPKDPCIREVGRAVIHYEIAGYGVVPESSLAPLETECQHMTESKWTVYKFCPLCGESLTKGDS